MGDSMSMSIKEWKDKIIQYESRVLKGEILSQQEKDHYEFLVYKLEDWESDGENSY